MRRESYRPRTAVGVHSRCRAPFSIACVYTVQPYRRLGGVSIGDFYMAQFWRARARAVHGVFEF